MRTLVWVLLSLAPLNPQQPPRDTTLPADGKAIVRGRVTAGDTGAPIAQAFIVLSPEEGDHRSSYAHTDERGRFEIRSLTPGRYHVQVQPPEYRSRYLASAFGGETFWGRGHGFDIAAGEVRDGLDVVLPVSAAISGHVLDEAGEPLAHVRVQPLRMRSKGRKPERIGNSLIQTDDLGRFRLFGLPEGEYLLEATPEPQQMRAKDSPPAFVATFYPSALTVDTAVSVRLKAGQDADGFDIALVRTKTYRIAGIVLTPDGQPWGNARASLTQLAIPMRVSVDASATFLLRRLHAPSVIRAWGTKEWYLKAVLLDDDDVTDRPIEFRNRDSGHLQVVLTRRGSTVEGDVTDSHGRVVNDCLVLLFSASKSDWTTYSTKNVFQSLGHNARFRFAGVRAGTYLLAAVPFDRAAGPDLMSPTLMESVAKEASSIVVGEDQQIQVTLKLLTASGEIERH